MKPFAPLLVFAALLLTSPAALAQKTPARSATTADGRLDLQNGDQFVMQNGAVVRRRDGQTTGLSQNVRLPGGTKINVKSGIVELTTGKMITLKEGDYVKADGGVMFATPQNAAASRGETAPPDAKFNEVVEVRAAPSGANVDSRLGELNRRVELMAQKIQLLNQKISLLSQNNPKAPDTSQLDGQIKALDEQLRAVK
ncbi:hypothetical protein EJV47_22135 [Hymenobacter gummosus]|uniref:DUF6799 domain-containing protein n=1 Tax=Hymenobacter gummosus TaxID=1776032 RepID=A0A431TXA6_9BACT|nr:DUF6799 domain-containing protein [Hymenobacter gummosus]RTQ46232.1 hypothetical protein EJV47_22135 [Hymenobacter gummosus]